MSYKAFLFDLNGTIIDDMHYHTQAWFNILTKQLGADLTFEQVEKEMYGKNEELLVRIFGSEKFTEAEMKTLSHKKEEEYQRQFRSFLKAINGLKNLLEMATRHNIKMAIGTAAIMFNVDFAVDGLHIRQYFEALISADEVKTSKPNPETYLLCAEKLGVKPTDCMVFEDSPKGIEAALNAGMDAVVIKTGHNEADFAHLPNIKFFINDYSDKKLFDLF